MMLELLPSFSAGATTEEEEEDDAKDKHEEGARYAVLP